MKQHQLSGISKLAPFLLASASRAAPSAASHGDSRVSVLLWGLASLGGGRGALRVWSVRDKSSLKHLCSRVQTPPDLACFIWWLLFCSSLWVEIIIKNPRGEEVVLRGSRPPQAAGETTALALRRAGSRSHQAPGRAFLANWAGANVSKQPGQNEGERRKAVGEPALKERAFCSGTHFFFFF